MHIVNTDTKSTKMISKIQLCIVVCLLAPPLPALTLEDHKTPAAQVVFLTKHEELLIGQQVDMSKAGKLTFTFTHPLISTVSVQV